MCFLYYCSKYQSNDFAWAKPGYEYNYEDLPINLILGTEKWIQFFSEKMTDNSLKELKNHLNESNENGQTFMKEMEPLLIYRE